MQSSTWASAGNPASPRETSWNSMELPSPPGPGPGPGVGPVGLLSPPPQPTASKRPGPSVTSRRILSLHDMVLSLRAPMGAVSDFWCRRGVRRRSYALLRRGDGRDRAVVGVEAAPHGHIPVFVGGVVTHEPAGPNLERPRNPSFS